MRRFAKERPLLEIERRWMSGTPHANVIPETRMRTVRTVTGFALVGGGLAMLALPGPGLLAIAAGLGMLAGEYHWARLLLAHLKGAAARVRSHTKR
jgi:hypothetical protein